MAKRYTYSFSEISTTIEAAGGESQLNKLLGEKGGNLALISRLEIPVPKGFTISTEACKDFYQQHPPSFPPGMWEETLASLHKLEEETSKKFGDTENPLIVCCRTGAFMDVDSLLHPILNLGLNDETVNALINLTNNPTFVWKNYCKLIRQYSVMILGLSEEIFESAFEQYKKDQSIEKEEDMSHEKYQQLAHIFKKIVESELDTTFPQDPFEQIRGAIATAFNSWNSEEAIAYRNYNKIDDNMGTAVNLISMVFGNIGQNSCSGYVFTRNSESGDSKTSGKFILNAADDELEKAQSNIQDLSELEQIMPDHYNQIIELSKKLEKSFKYMERIDFVIEDGTLWVIEMTRGKRTPSAAIKIANDMVSEGILTKEEAISRISTEAVFTFVRNHFNDSDLVTAYEKLFARGIPNNTQAAVGQIYFTEEDAINKSKTQKVILVQEDIPSNDNLLQCLTGIIANKGGANSHKAISLREKGIAAVVGVSQLIIDPQNKTVSYGEKTLKESDFVSIDGITSTIYEGQLPLVSQSGKNNKELNNILQWADEIRAKKGNRKIVNGSSDLGLQIWGIADNANEQALSKENGAEGILGCKLDSLLDNEMIKSIQDMILTDNSQTRDELMAKVGEKLAKQLGDFFKGSNSLPTSIRLIESSIASFLPDKLQLIEDVTILKVTAELGQEIDLKELEEKERRLQELTTLEQSNPMIGLRGVRMGIVYPCFLRMQLKAIIEGACLAASSKPKPYILVPFVCHENEMEKVRLIFNEVKAEVFKQKNANLEILLGASIEVPRSALITSTLSQHVDFLYYSLNDLTQFSLLYSTDDAESSFVPEYREWNIISPSPFMSIDDAIGNMINTSIAEARKQKPSLFIGVECESAGFDTIQTIHNVGADYVACNPYRIFINRIAAAQATLKEKS